MNVATVSLNVGTPATICPSASTGGVAIPVAVSAASEIVATLAATAFEATPMGGASWIDTVTGYVPSSAYVLVPSTSNTPVRVGSLTMAAVAVVLPSPQTIFALKLESG